MREAKRSEAIKNSHQKAQALRNYSKVCAREGIQSDRVRAVRAADSMPTTSTTQPTRPHKPFPFKKELEVAERLKDLSSKKVSEQQQRVSEIRSAATERRKKRREHGHITKSGQPVLKNKINKLLSKLQAPAK
jgi:hypothetical protein